MTTRLKFAEAFVAFGVAALSSGTSAAVDASNPLAGMTLEQRIEATAPITTGTELPITMVPNIPEAAEAYYGPDSKLLIAQTRDPDAKKTSMGTAGALTWIFADDGSKSWRANDAGQDACSYIFPDGKKVVFTSTRDNMDMPVGNWSDSNDYPQGAELYIADLDGKNRKRLTNNKYYEAEVSVSHDGKKIVFGRQINGKMDLWIMNADGTGERQLTNTPDWQEGAPFFMPGDDRIMFRAWRASEYGKISPTPMTVFTIKTDGTDWRRHTYDRSMNWAPFPAPDGRHFVFVRVTDKEKNNWDVYLGDLAGTPPQRLTFNDKFDGFPAVSPDGKKIVFARSTGERFMTNIKTFVMDATSLNLSTPQKFNPDWGLPMQDDPVPAQK
ncbi:MAG: PD40 domain-containing protein [Rhodospirillaceae bacterium]|nr:PD40 domain-containing protein [Rhodospirillaceae bacterium]